jgi:hypothetical protein
MALSNAAAPAPNTPLNQALYDLVQKKVALSAMDYSDEAYDALEDEIHELEDAFMEAHGEILEDAMSDIHDQFCPKTEVLFPTAYIAKRYEETGEDFFGLPALDADLGEGVPIELKKAPSAEARLVLVPNPTRIQLHVAGAKRVLWQEQAA